MAEIKIEKKKAVWPWIVVVLLISALVYYIFLRDNDTQGERRVEIENTTTSGTTN
ncbi:hypothetical protein IRZ83_13340 [Flavobacterium sp. JLP]|uniref:hypothetical protein n=1 Tax=unclassified Flavobacterium TaxID=196869 RepID=UPI000B33515D|nr:MULTISPECIES: hypothetical protein [unclassified Flavobacterium]MBF4494244.1 hypothetical protein [Flavobacterium sp. MR2016-29]MBF4507654.1 hypothetical protein [Flavobacterium sp. JLP]